MHQIENLGFWKKITLAPRYSGGELFPRAVYKMTADWENYKPPKDRKKIKVSSGQIAHYQYGKLPTA